MIATAILRTIIVSVCSISIVYTPHRFSESTFSEQKQTSVNPSSGEILLASLWEKPKNNERTSSVGQYDAAVAVVASKHIPTIKHSSPSFENSTTLSSLLLTSQYTSSAL